MAMIVVREIRGGREAAGRAREVYRFLRLGGVQTVRVDADAFSARVSVAEAEVEKARAMLIARTPTGKRAPKKKARDPLDWMTGSRISRKKGTVEFF